MTDAGAQDVRTLISLLREIMKKALDALDGA